MKKTILILAFAGFSLCGFTQNLLTYQINAKVVLSNGDSITSGTVCSFNAYVNEVNTTGKIAYDMQNAIKVYLESIYGIGNIVIVN